MIHSVDSVLFYESDMFNEWMIHSVDSVLFYESDMFNEWMIHCWLGSFLWIGHV